MAINEKDNLIKDAPTRVMSVAGADPDVVTKTRASLHDEKLVEIKIASTETQRDDVPIGINGYVYQIKRDKWVKVPASVIAQLNNLVQINYVQRKREDGEGNELVPTPTLRFPYQMRV